MAYDIISAIETIIAYRDNYSDGDKRVNKLLKDGWRLLCINTGLYQSSGPVVSQSMAIVYVMGKVDTIPEDVSI